MFTVVVRVYMVCSLVHGWSLSSLFFLLLLFILKLIDVFLKASLEIGRGSETNCHFSFFFPFLSSSTVLLPSSDCIMHTLQLQNGKLFSYFKCCYTLTTSRAAAMRKLSKF